MHNKPVCLHGSGPVPGAWARPMWALNLLYMYAYATLNYPNPCYVVNLHVIICHFILFLYKYESYTMLHCSALFHMTSISSLHKSVLFYVMYICFHVIPCYVVSIRLLPTGARSNTNNKNLLDMQRLTKTSKVSVLQSTILQTMVCFQFPPTSYTVYETCWKEAWPAANSMIPNTTT